MKKYTISLLLIVCTISLSGQVEIFENSVVLDSYHAPYQSYHVRANKSIELAAGFSFDAMYYGNDFFAEIELKELAVAEESSLEGGPDGDLGILVGTDGVVGAIPGSFNVSPSGAATYTIPIECPPGINGMTPQVALTYNSQAGNGIAGWGWNITGISAISRVPKNQYYNDTVRAIQWDDTDDFAYNGVRMFEIDDGDSDNTTKEYRLENDPTIKIVAFDCTTHGPYWFKVYTGDGKTYYYGDTENSQMFDRWDLLDDHTSEHTLSWNLSKVEDPFGNYIDYLYEYDEIDSDYSVYYYGNFRLSEINYTGTAVDEPFYTVNFGYGNRFDVISNYISTKKFVNSKKLFEISTTYNTTEINSYLLHYSSVETYMVLGGITKYGLDGEKYNKTVFEYGESSSEATAIKVADHNSLLDLESLIPGDFNGDGTADFCVQSSNDYGGAKQLRLEFFLREKSGSNYSTTRVGNGSFLIGTYASGTYGIPLSLPNFMSGDANGNGITDILSYGYNNGYLAWNIHELQYNNEWQMTPLFTGGMTTNILDSHDYYISLAEFNGDGILDVVVVNKTLCTTNQGNLEHTFYFEISDGTNGHNSYSCDIGLSTGKIKDIYITDNNGDGLSDIIMMDDYSNSKVAHSTGNLNQIFDYPLKNCNIVKNTIKGSGDFNVDGLLDLVLKEDDTDLTLAINLGTGSYQKFSHSVTWNDESDMENDRVFVTDLDDDGIPDVLVSDELYDHRILFPDEYESTTWKEFISRGADFFNHNSSNNITNTNKSNSVTYGDFYADGKDDKFEYIIGDDNYMIGNHYYSNNNYKQLLGKVTNSIGRELDITYQPLNEDAGIYTPGTHAYPLRSYSNSYFPVVSQVIQNDQTMNYLYTDATLNMLGKGFLGYTKVATENSTQNIKTISETSLA